MNESSKFENSQKKNIALMKNKGFKDLWLLQILMPRFAQLFLDDK